MSQRVVYARLPNEQHLKLKLLAAEETSRSGRRVSLQGMVSLLIQRAVISTQSPSPFETAKAAFDEQQTTSFETSKQLLDL